MLTMMNLFLLRTHFNFAMVCMIRPPASSLSIPTNSTVPEVQTLEGGTISFTKTSAADEVVSRHSPFVREGTFFGGQGVLVTNVGAPVPAAAVSEITVTSEGQNNVGIGLGGESVYDVYGTRSLLSLSTTADAAGDGERRRVTRVGAWTIDGNGKHLDDNVIDAGLTPTDAICSQSYPGSTLHYEVHQNSGFCT
jgi:hypothetical protein